MLINKSVVLEEADMYQAVRDYLVKTLIVENPGDVCSVTLDDEKCMARVMLQQEQIKP